MSENKKRILITGASSGIGAAVASVLDAQGYQLALLGRNNERLIEINNTLKNSCSQNKLIVFDLIKLDLIEDMIRQLVGDWGKLSGFVHCAGIARTVPLSQLKPFSYSDLLDINGTSSIELARVLSKKKNIQEGLVSFVFIGSVMSFLGSKGNIAYCASKSMMVSSIKSMALELASKRIRCNIVSPAFVKTNMLLKEIEKLGTAFENDLLNKHPLGLGEPVDIAELVAFLISEKSRWITGQNIVIDGGYSIQ